MQAASFERLTGFPFVIDSHSKNLAVEKNISTQAAATTRPMANSGKSAGRPKLSKDRPWCRPPASDRDAGRILELEILVRPEGLELGRERKKKGYHGNWRFLPRNFSTCQTDLFCHSNTRRGGMEWRALDRVNWLSIRHFICRCVFIRRLPCFFFKLAKRIHFQHDSVFVVIDLNVTIWNL